MRPFQAAVQAVQARHRPPLRPQHPPTASTPAFLRMLPYVVLRRWISLFWGPGARREQEGALRKPLVACPFTTCHPACNPVAPPAALDLT